MISNARSELEHFFATDHELDATHARDIHYLIKKQHIRRQLGDRAPIALHALRTTEDFLQHWCLLSGEQRARKTKAEFVDARLLNPWFEELFGKNRESVALAILDALLTVQVPEVPEVPPEALTHYIASHGFIADAEGRRAAWIDGTIVIDPAVPSETQRQF